jgi:PHD-finger
MGKTDWKNNPAQEFTGPVHDHAGDQTTSSASRDIAVTQETNKFIGMAVTENENASFAGSATDGVVQQEAVNSSIGLGKQVACAQEPAQDELDAPQGMERGLSSPTAILFQMAQCPKDMPQDGRSDDRRHVTETSANAPMTQREVGTTTTELLTDLPTTGQDDKKMTSSGSRTDVVDLVVFGDRPLWPTNPSAFLAPERGEMSASSTNDDIDLVVYSDRPQWPVNPSSLLAPPRKKRKTILPLKLTSTDEPHLTADCKVEYDAAMLDYCEGNFVPKSGRGISTAPRLRRLKNGQEPQRRGGRRKVSTPREDPNRRALVVHFSSSVGPLDKNAYRSELRQLDVGLVQCWSPDVVIGSDQDRLSQQLASVSQDLSTQTAFMEAVYRAGGLQDFETTKSTLVNAQRQDGEVKWENEPHRQTIMSSLAYTKEFAKVAKKLCCSVGTLLVDYYRWKGKNPVAYRNAKQQRTREREDCATCGKPGRLIVCESCAKAFHLGCVYPPLKSVPEGSWLCSSCCTSSRSAKRQCLIINRKSPTKVHGPSDTLTGTAGVSTSKQRLSFNSTQSRIRTKLATDMEGMSQRLTTLPDSQLRFIRPRGMVWDSSQNAWSRPSMSLDEYSTADSTSDDLLSSSSTNGDGQAPEEYSVSSSDEELGDQKNKVIDLVASSSEDDDEEFKVDEASDPESETESFVDEKKPNRTQNLPQTLDQNANRNAQVITQTLYRASNPTTENRDTQNRTQVLDRVAKNPTIADRNAQGITHNLQRVVNRTIVDHNTQWTTQALDRGLNLLIVDRTTQGRTQDFPPSANLTFPDRNALGTTQTLPPTVPGFTQTLHPAAHPTAMNRNTQGSTQNIRQTMNPTIGHGTAPGITQTLQQAVNPAAPTMQQPITAHNPHNSARPQMEVYQTHLPFTESGLLILIRPVLPRLSIGACFSNYRRTPNGHIGPAEAARALRGPGDVFLSIDNVPCEFMSFERIKTLLAYRVEGQLHKVVQMRRFHRT